jgi:hypothetical protein
MRPATAGKLFASAGADRKTTRQERIAHQEDRLMTG